MPLVDRLEMRGRPLEVAELGLGPATCEAAQSIGAHTLHTESLLEEVDDRLVERLALAALLSVQSVREVGRHVPDRQNLDPLLLARSAKT